MSQSGDCDNSNVTWESVIEKSTKSITQTYVQQQLQASSPLRSVIIVLAHNLIIAAADNNFFRHQVVAVHLPRKSWWQPLFSTVFNRQHLSYCMMYTSKHIGGDCLSMFARLRLNIILFRHVSIFLNGYFFQWEFFKPVDPLLRTPLLYAS